MATLLGVRVWKALVKRRAAPRGGRGRCAWRRRSDAAPPSRRARRAPRWRNPLACACGSPADGSAPEAVATGGARRTTRAAGAADHQPPGAAAGLRRPAAGEVRLDADCRRRQLRHRPGQRDRHRGVADRPGSGRPRWTGRPSSRCRPARISGWSRATPRAGGSRNPAAPRSSSSAESRAGRASFAWCGILILFCRGVEQSGSSLGS